MAEAIITPHVEEPKKKAPAQGDETSLITGSEAIAVACQLADVDVITAYPIRPYDTVMQYVAKLVANGEMDCEYIVAEGEHSQFEIVKHASACGARVFTGSSGVGWMYAMECLTVTPSLRIPMIAMVGNRALDDPKIPSRAKVDAFLPRYDRKDLLLHPDNPITVAPQANEDWLMEIRRGTAAAMERSAGVIREAYADFERIFGRKYGNPFFEEYMTDDADVVLVGMGTLSNPVRVAIRQMREEGKKVGFVRLRWFRPFPAEELAKSLGRFKAVGVIDRDFSLGSPYHSGVVATEVRTALYQSENRPQVVGFICGLGGREVTLPDVRKMSEIVSQAASGKPQPATQWIGLRE
ncbi:MAG: pyruvate ferredoxin oxidoreductase [Deltaproteobacteria bacterium]|nr:MAG: pyruvate ferredoxin oxidoreductase [Deltaproteobacteria bacterium]